MQLYVGKYDVFGNYYGMEALTTQFMLCGANYDDGIRFRSFGSTIQNRYIIFDISCNLDLRQFIPRSYKMYFYELFMLDPVSGQLIDIPILITNIMTQSNGKPNLSQDSTNYVLTRRFYIVDNLSGIQGQGNFINNSTSTNVIRFAKTISFNVNLMTNATARITTPYLSITYQSRQIDSLNLSPSASIIFQSMYFMDLSSIKNTLLAFFITLNILVGVVVSVKMYIWTKNNPSELSPVNFN